MMQMATAYSIVSLHYSQKQRKETYWILLCIRMEIYSPPTRHCCCSQCCQICPPNLISELPRSEVQRCAAAPEANQPLR